MLVPTVSINVVSSWMKQYLGRIIESMEIKSAREGSTLGIQQTVLTLQSTNQCVRNSEIL
jgi:hypothetical protein